MSKKGQSLVEVVVALGILSVIFAGTINLIVTVINLELSARKRTDAINLAQTELNSKLVEIEEGCGNAIASDTGFIDKGDFKYKVVVSDNDAQLNYGEGINGTYFVEVSTEVKWTPKGLQEENILLKQLVRK